MPIAGIAEVNTVIPQSVLDVSPQEGNTRVDVKQAIASNDRLNRVGELYKPE